MSETPSLRLEEDLQEEKVNTMSLAVEPNSPSDLENATQLKAASKDIGFFTSIGFTLGFSALLFLNTYGIPAGLAMVFSGFGLWQVKRKGEPGRAYAIWGIVLALLSLVWLGLQYLGVVTTPGMLFNFIKGLLGFRT